MRLNDTQRAVYDITRNVFNSNFKFNTKNYPLLDMEEFFGIIKQQKIYNIVYRCIQNCISEDFDEKFKKSFYNYKNKIDDLISEALKINFKLNNNEVNTCLVKGFVLSYIIYGDIYSRNFSDLDFLVDKNSQYNCCEMIRKMGYKEHNIELFRNDYYISQNAIVVYYLSDIEKQFKKDNIYVELKKETGKFSQEVRKSLLNSINVDIDGVICSTLSLSDTFLLLIDNTYKNFFSDYGKKHDFIIRDLLDFYGFVVKYKKLFNEEFLIVIKKADYFGELCEIIKLLKLFFSDEPIKRLPKVFLELCLHEDIKKDVFLGFIFNKSQRCQYYNYLEYQNIHDTWLVLKANDLSVYPYNYKKGVIDIIYQMTPSPLVSNIVMKIIWYKIDYNDSSIFYSFRIPHEYKSLRIEIIQYMSNCKEKDALFICMEFDYIDEKITNVGVEEDTINIYDIKEVDTNIIVIEIPKSSKIVFNFDDMPNYMGYCNIWLLEDKLKMGQPLFCAGYSRFPCRIIDDTYGFPKNK